jgi:hypothetical protein
MAAGDMAAGEHHHHQGRADGKRRNHTCAGPDAGASNGEDKKKSSNEFRYVFVHVVRFISSIVSWLS